jgi:hypothetical protein
VSPLLVGLKLEGTKVGATVGLKLGFADGTPVGKLEGVPDGKAGGIPDGILDGNDVGWVGSTVGSTVGVTVGYSEGVNVVGNNVGDLLLKIVTIRGEKSTLSVIISKLGAVDVERYLAANNLSLSASCRAPEVKLEDKELRALAASLLKIATLGKLVFSFNVIVTLINASAKSDNDRWNGCNDEL